MGSTTHENFLTTKYFQTTVLYRPVFTETKFCFMLSFTRLKEQQPCVIRLPCIQGIITNSKNTIASSSYTEFIMQQLVTIQITLQEHSKGKFITNKQYVVAFTRLLCSKNVPSNVLL